MMAIGLAVDFVEAAISLKDGWVDENDLDKVDLGLVVTVSAVASCFLVGWLKRPFLHQSPI